MHITRLKRVTFLCLWVVYNQKMSSFFSDTGHNVSWIAVFCQFAGRFWIWSGGVLHLYNDLYIKSCSITACLDVCPAITLSSIIWSSVDELPLPWSLEYVHKLFLTLLNKFLLSISSTSVDFFWVMLYSFTMKWIILGFKMNDLIYFIVQTSGVGKKLILLFSKNEFNWSKVRVRLL